MQIFLPTLLIALISVAGLALGALFGRAPLRGSCGGLACGGACAACPKQHGKEPKP
jgi:hypothetical protein